MAPPRPGGPRRPRSREVGKGRCGTATRTHAAIHSAAGQPPRAHARALRRRPPRDARRGSSQEITLRGEAICTRSTSVERAPERCSGRARLTHGKSAVRVRTLPSPCAAPGANPRRRARYPTRARRAAPRVRTDLARLAVGSAAPACAGHAPLINRTRGSPKSRRTFPAAQRSRAGSSKAPAVAPRARGVLLRRRRGGVTSARQLVMWCDART